MANNPWISQTNGECCRGLSPGLDLNCQRAEKWTKKKKRPAWLFHNWQTWWVIKGNRQTNWNEPVMSKKHSRPFPFLQYNTLLHHLGLDTKCELFQKTDSGFFFWIHRDLWALVFSNNSVSYDWIMFYFLFFLDKPPRGTAALVKGERNTSQDKIIEDLLKGGHIFFFSLSTNSMKRTNYKMFLFLSKNIRDIQQWSSVTQKIMLI